MPETKSKSPRERVETFLAGLEPQRQQEALALAEMMERITGREPAMWGRRTIGYGRYSDRDWNGRKVTFFLAGFSPRKRDLAIYMLLGFTPFAAIMNRLGKYKTDETGIYVKQLEDIDIVRLEELIRASTAMMIQKYGPGAEIARPAKPAEQPETAKAELTPIAPHTNVTPAHVEERVEQGRTIMAEKIDAELAEAARAAKAWPFEEARKLVKRIEKRGEDAEAKDVIFETGYGPSGLPHIGTFGEVARTSMVRHAFNVLTDGRIKTRLICFSDDMDALRKVPDNVPNQEMMTEYLGKPLSAIPDPFSNEYPSFAAHNNARLRRFLDQFGFEYEFFSATDCYKSGMMDATLLKMLEVYDKVMDIILPTVGPERQKTYSPFLPVCQRTGQVLQVPMIARDVEAGTVSYIDPETGETVETPVTGGRVKCQWKADWAMRWAALGVDYEMAGKDLIDSVNLSSKICRALGGTPPEGFNYELFLDEKGEKISKSKGNGITIDDWLTYATPESLSLFMYQKPKTAKKLYFDVIPKNVDEYFTFLGKYPEEGLEQHVANPVWHIHLGDPPKVDVPVSFNLLLNLVSASNAHEKGVLWGFIRRYAPDATPENHPELDQLVGYAISYFHDFVKPAKQFREASEQERAAIIDLHERLGKLPEGASGEEIQNEVYAVGKEHEFEPLRAWFLALYEVLLGQSQGPRFGSFVELYGVAETREMIARTLGLDATGEAKAKVSA